MGDGVSCGSLALLRGFELKPQAFGGDIPELSPRLPLPSMATAGALIGGESVQAFGFGDFEKQCHAALRFDGAVQITSV